jgi:hypothetical protein
MKKISFLLISILFITSLSGLAQAKKKPEANPESKTEEVDISGLFYKGDKVEALWQGAWYKGQIMFRDKPNYYMVHFEGYWHNRDEVLPADRVRKPVKRVQPNPADLKSGDSVEIYQGDHYQPAVFVEDKGKGKALVRIADGDKSKEEQVDLYKLSKVQ